MIKNSQEIKIMIEAGKKLAQVKKIIYDMIDVNISLLELDKKAYDEIIKLDCKPSFLGYQDYPNTACISVNNQLIHGIPTDYKIQDGDIVSVDLGLIYKGFHSDSAFTKGVGNISDNDKKVIEVAEESFYAGVDAIKPGARTGDIGYAISQVIKKNNMFTPHDFSGHGIGKSLHEDPVVNNHGVRGTGTLLKDGMVICIEPMILQKSEEIIWDQDGWTIWSEDGKNASHYEHTIAIIDGKPKILTEGI